MPRCQRYCVSESLPSYKLASVNWLLLYIPGPPLAPKILPISDSKKVVALKRSFSLASHTITPMCGRHYYPSRVLCYYQARQPKSSPCMYGWPDGAVVNLWLNPSIPKMIWLTIVVPNEDSTVLFISNDAHVILKPTAHVSRRKNMRGTLV